MTTEQTKRARKPRAPAPATRAELMEQHAAARQRRNMAQLGSPDYRAAAEDLARIEIAIAQLEEPPQA
jgi:transcription elongation GreA/GreB family factor